MNEQDNNVADEQLRKAFEEVGGRATPPNRLHEILQRAAAAAGPQPGDHQAKQFQTGKLWAAALLLLGLGTTITASVLKNQTDESATQPRLVVTSVGDDSLTNHDPAGAEIVAMAQDPKPKPKPKPKPSKPGSQDPVGKQNPKPAGKPDTNNKKDVPGGLDPEDLRVLRSAEAMLEAEKKLLKLIKDGKIAGVDQVLPFDQLEDWKYTDGLEGMPKKVKALDGKKVLMLGFMLPIDEVTDIKQFLLVESLWSCCYGQPPNIHGIVRAIMPKGKTLDYQFEPLKLVGTLKIEATKMDDYVVDIYQLQIDYVEVIEAAKPASPVPTKKDLKKAAEMKNKRGC